jgi:hypothetical protein
MTLRVFGDMDQQANHRGRQLLPAHPAHLSQLSDVDPADNRAASLQRLPQPVQQSSRPGPGSISDRSC